MAFVTVSVNLKSLRVSRARLVSGALVALALAVGTAGYFGYTQLERQRAEMEVLIRDLASTRVERDDLQRRSTELTENLEGANARIGGLQADVEMAHGDITRLEEEAAVLRDRIQVVRTEARDATSDAEAARSAQARADNVSGAALAYANASSDLSDTRNRMLNFCKDSFSASSRGLHSLAISLENQHNALVPAHNRQVSVANAALTRLRAVLRG